MFVELVELSSMWVTLWKRTHPRLVSKKLHWGEKWRRERKREETLMWWRPFQILVQTGSEFLLIFSLVCSPREALSVINQRSLWLNVESVGDPPSPKNPIVVTMVWWVAWVAKSSSKDVMKTTSREETFQSIPASMKMEIVRSIMSYLVLSANIVDSWNVPFWVWIQPGYWGKRPEKNSAPKSTELLKDNWKT